MATLVDGGHHAMALSRAYYAAFYAASAALASLGRSSSRHAGLVAAFGRFVVREAGADPELGRTLASLFAARNVADYDEEVVVSAERAAASLAAATEFVDGVDAWLARRG